MLHVGLDLSRKRVDVCLISSEGELVEHFCSPCDGDLAADAGAARRARTRPLAVASGQASRDAQEPKAMRRIWRQLGQAEWIVDGDISDFFGSLSHERLIDLVADRVADGKVLSLIRSMLTAGHPEKTRIVHITRGFEFLGYKIGRGRGLRHKAGGPSLYALPTDRSIKRFKDKVRTATNRRNPKDLEGMLDELNPIIRGWGNYYRRAHVRRIYNRLNHWIVMRVWNHQHKHWRNAGWRDLPDRRLYGELGLVNLLQLIPSMENYYRQKGLVR
jgi:hypothetical protein